MNESLMSFDELRVKHLTPGMMFRVLVTGNYEKIYMIIAVVPLDVGFYINILSSFESFSEILELHLIKDKHVFPSWVRI